MTFGRKKIDSKVNKRHLTFVCIRIIQQQFLLADVSICGRLDLDTNSIDQGETILASQANVIFHAIDADAIDICVRSFAVSLLVAKFVRIARSVNRTAATTAFTFGR